MPALGATAKQAQTNPLMDNYEGMITKSLGHHIYRVTLISDDNFNPTQITRTLELIAVDVLARLMPTVPSRPTDLRRFLRQVAVLPWLIGAVLFNLTALPLDNGFGPQATATSGLFTLVAMGPTGRRFAS